MGDDGIEMRVVFRDREEGSVYLVLGSLTPPTSLKMKRPASSRAV